MKTKSTQKIRRKRKFRYRSAVTGELLTKSEFNKMDKDHTVRETITPEIEPEQKPIVKPKAKKKAKTKSKTKKDE